eukprot:CAMPEP_0201621962 /NCGR_PEP_ID=MMETSP0492-20130828/47159_1 /ASSEMBLY_ACC=CAM_ASM_000837 /TAXON_ID=420259 /ORGANISM="Thalassiosira gravida, Strain GMp14c1" /LENGTH=345 /DNA_ID=CAMNT_0048091533 /DNA_START=1 /DNA_END=1039 /DNA_ORIENTATION=-
MLYRERCLATNRRMVRKYHSMFPDIPTMTSNELVTTRWNWNAAAIDDFDVEDDADDKGPLLLIDCRSKSERNVSMIPGAYAMDDDGDAITEWIDKYVRRIIDTDNNNNNKNNNNSNDNVDSEWIDKYVRRIIDTDNNNNNKNNNNSNDNVDSDEHEGKSGSSGMQMQPTIVTYCTIGYRSGRDAQYLVDTLTDDRRGIDIGKSVDIKNLDGILSYSFVENAPPLIAHSRPGMRYHRRHHRNVGTTGGGGSTGGSDDESFATTRRVHSYGREWSAAANPDYEVVYFDTALRRARHSVQTGLTCAFRMVQHQFRREEDNATNTTTTATITADVVDVEMHAENIVYIA